MKIKISFSGLAIISYIKSLYLMYKEKKEKIKHQAQLNKYNNHIQYQKDAITRLQNDRRRYCFAIYEYHDWYIGEEIHFDILGPSQYRLYADVYTISKDSNNQWHYKFLRNRSLGGENMDAIIDSINRCKNALKMTSDYLKNKYLKYHIFNSDVIIEYKYILVLNDNILSEGIKIENDYKDSLFFHTFEDMVDYYNIYVTKDIEDNNSKLLLSKIRC